MPMPVGGPPHATATRSKGVGGQVSSFSPFGAVIPDEITGTGTVLVHAVTGGDGTDPDGYLVSIDEGEPLPIDVDGDRSFPGLTPGLHVLFLSDVAEGCSLDDANPRLVEVTAGNVTETTFHVTCGFIPPPEGDIVFTSARDGNLEIYTMKSDGSDQGRLTVHEEVDEWPALSPDATQVAFERFVEGDVEVFRMNADGSNPVNLTNRPGIIDTQPAWSPSGDELCFTSTRPEGFPNIFVMGADGSNVVQLTSAGGTNCTWSPDGEQIAFRTFRDGNQEIYVMDSDGSDETNITNNPSQDFNPSWSPDGETIVFDADRGGTAFNVWIMNANGSNPEQLTDDPVGDLDPRWLPDGSKILFTRFSVGGGEVFMMNPDGTGAVNLTDNPAIDLTGGFLLF
jgi:Tol biopolymer transport system component